MRHRWTRWLGALVLAYAAFEFGLVRWWGRRRALEHAEDWSFRYATQQQAARVRAVRATHTVFSGGMALHVDVLPQPGAPAPVVVMVHGAAGYCRMFSVLTLEMFACGYTMVLPDQLGQGLSGGVRGDYTVAACAQNIRDVVAWARAHFPGVPVYLAGASLGGGVAYHAVALGTPVRAAACVNLFDFGNPATMLRHVGRWPTLAPWLERALPLLRVFGWLRVPMPLMGAFHNMVDGREPTLAAAYLHDPVPARWVTLRTLLSVLDTAPPVPHAANTTPMLVLNQGADKMVDPRATAIAYARLGGPKRYAVLGDYGHWSNSDGFRRAVVDAADAWFRAHP